MLKQYTFLALVLVGCAMLILDQDTNRFGRMPNFVWVAEHSQACTRTFGMAGTTRAQFALTADRGNSLWLNNALAELRARIRASITSLQAEECCWLNSIGRNLHKKSSSQASPAWRDVQYDAQQLAKILGICKQEPV